jgi:hypothetical protein
MPVSTLTRPDQINRLLHPRAGAPEIVDVPELNFLMVDGKGDPEKAGEFQDAIGALYTVSYGAHFALKKVGVESRIMPLEALWWSSSGDFLDADRSRWRWTAMIMQPEAVTPEVIEKVRAEAMRKKPLASLSRARLEAFREGRCAQVMHVGPYSAERPTIENLHAFIATQGCRPVGRHHEIYMGDPRRAAPEKLRTIIRQPIARA